MSLAYRREIDGLRAVAVASVVLFHAGFAPAAGYVGVDVFFVISGYLITALLVNECDATGRIDLWNFYARRARRILPAFAVVVLTVLLLARLLAPPGSVGDIGQSAAAGAAFVANLYFQAQTSGYWGADAAQMPLLHLWSLSVEEQFYLLWPALLMLAPRAWRPGVLAGVALVSIAMAEWLLRGAAPDAAFYQMPARCWELAAGALVAVLPARALPAWTVWLGLAGIVAGCLFPIAHFPGLGALPVVAATALVLAAIRGGAGNALLASKPMVGLGLVSYSLYLWHWPLLALDRLLRVGPSPLSMRLLLVAVALLLAIASYRYVEAPLRRQWLPKRATVVAGATALLLLAGFAWPKTPATPVPLSAAQLAAGDHASYAVCSYQPMESMAVFPQANCSPSHAQVVAWGDSMAKAWQPYARTRGSTFIGFSRARCPPLLGVKIGEQARVQGRLCEQFNASAADWIVAHHPRVVVLGGRWSYYDDTDVEAGLRAAIVRIAPSVDRIIVFGPSPEMPDLVPRCMELGVRCNVTRAQVEATNRDAFAMLARLDQMPKVEVVDVLPFLCSDANCPGIRGGVPLYSDAFHPSGRAARAFAVSAFGPGPTTAP